MHGPGASTRIGFRKTLGHVKLSRYLLVVGTVLARSASIEDSIPKESKSIDKARWVVNMPRDTLELHPWMIVILGLVYYSCPD